MIELANRQTNAITDTNYCNGKSKTRPETIQRRHSASIMIKFLTSRKSLFTIKELPILETSSSFTAGTTPTKPSRKTMSSKKKKNKSSKKTTHAHTVQQSLEAALSIVDSATEDLRRIEDTKREIHKNHQFLQSSLNSIATCSTASLSCSEDDHSTSSDKGEKQKQKQKRKISKELLPKAPLLRGSLRWDEQSKYLGTGETHHLYSKVRGKRNDGPPVCPVRR